MYQLLLRDDMYLPKYRIKTSEQDCRRDRVWCP